MGLRFGALGCVCLLFFGLLLFGCGAAEEVESEVQEVAEDPIDTIEVNETEFGLDPADITLDQPGTYVFRAVNVGNAVHSLEIEGQGIEEETPNIQPGESSQLKINLDPGTYKLYCPVGNHEERGMVGTVTVQEA
jgi:plastocyanin